MLVLALKVSVAVLLVATGMSVTVKEVAWLWRRPVLLAKSFLAMYVVAPVVAVLMARTLDLPRPTEVALVILAICAGAPLLPRKLIKLGGDAPYVFSLVVTTSLLAIDGVLIVVLCRELPGDRVKVSLRSKGDLDMHRMAGEFGGGGHRNASGIVMPGTLEHVAETVTERARSLLARRG